MIFKCFYDLKKCSSILYKILSALKSITLSQWEVILYEEIKQDILYLLRMINSISELDIPG